ncbi:MAG: 3-deoxy-manno-octulosonate cytidylyltransferase [Deltaproteobacteria bacterium]|nr:3-deoxy-manno-octulosonate cytidylyltransferase [Deltaproteobacteria bacterium]
MNSHVALSSVIVIPSRYGSTRFPGKPLAKIAGRTLLERVWELASAVSGVNDVYIATDSDRIRQHAASFGAKVVMTSPDCKNGTERVYQVVRGLQQKPDVVINFQGDAVLTPPHILQALLSAMAVDRSIEIATPAVRLSAKQFQELREAKQRAEVGGTFVVFDRNHRALYFSKAPIPHLRKSDLRRPPAFRHIGMYAYTSEALAKYLSLPASPLEEAEQLEQLRALENGMDVRVVEVDYGGRTAGSVDTPEDVLAIEEIIEREGEILPIS